MRHILIGGGRNFGRKETKQLRGIMELRRTNNAIERFRELNPTLTSEELNSIIGRVNLKKEFALAEFLYMLERLLDRQAVETRLVKGLNALNKSYQIKKGRTLDEFFQRVALAMLGTTKAQIESEKEEASKIIMGS